MGERYCLACGVRVFRTHRCQPVRRPDPAQVAENAAACRAAIEEGLARRAAPQLELFPEEGAP